MLWSDSFNGGLASLVDSSILRCLARLGARDGHICAKVYRGTPLRTMASILVGCSCERLGAAVSTDVVLSREGGSEQCSVEVGINIFRIWLLRDRMCRAVHHPPPRTSNTLPLSSALDASTMRLRRSDIELRCHIQRSVGCSSVLPTTLRQVAKFRRHIAFIFSHTAFLFLTSCLRLTHANHLFPFTL